MSPELHRVLTRHRIEQLRVAGESRRFLVRPVAEPGPHRRALRPGVEAPLKATRPDQA